VLTATPNIFVKPHHYRQRKPRENENTARDIPFVQDTLGRVAEISVYRVLVVRDSAGGMATRYGLDGPGNESRWG